MTVRLDRLVTRTGDQGTTALADGTRVAKHHPLIEAIGSVDEANSVLGLVLTEPLPAGVAEELQRVQNDLFDLGGDLAVPPGGPYEEKIQRVSAIQVSRLETAVAAATNQVEPLRSFVLPGGSRAAALLHVARTTVRRAERSLTAAIAADTVRPWNPEILRYLNRLSDLCFAWSRLANDGGRSDVLWRPGANR
ncbi:cob(I)yrinic acid a,c-diamide adenosyltransferase [Planctomycetota bacterium]|nr:cob(I)yrinic acid a,c-diamide adenosyltransferase [Planctomycetota bacterium]